MCQRAQIPSADEAVHLPPDTPVPAATDTVPPHGSLLSNPSDEKLEPGEGPQLLQIAVKGRRCDLCPPAFDYSWPPLPLERVHTYHYTRQVPSRASHVSDCRAEDAKWRLIIYAYAGSGDTFDAFRCWLVSEDKDTRFVVAKVVWRSPASFDAVKREAELYNTALMPLQGNQVPLFYGVFKITPPPEHSLDGEYYVVILEDCGWQATPEAERWSFALLSSKDKKSLRGVVEAVHRCGVLHNDIEPQNVIRRSSPHPGIVDDNDGDLCLIDFSEAQLGTEQELAEETEVLEEALNLSVERLPGDPDE